MYIPCLITGGLACVPNGQNSCGSNVADCVNFPSASCEIEDGVVTWECESTGELQDVTAECGGAGT